MKFLTSHYVELDRLSWVHMEKINGKNYYFLNNNLNSNFFIFNTNMYTDFVRKNNKKTIGTLK